MKVVKEGDLFVTTPVFMGMQTDAENTCPDDSHVWKDRDEQVPFPNDPDCIIQPQLCQNCCATRSRFIGDAKAIEEHLSELT